MIEIFGWNKNSWLVLFVLLVFLFSFGALSSAQENNDSEEKAAITTEQNAQEELVTEHEAAVDASDDLELSVVEAEPPADQAERRS